MAAFEFREVCKSFGDVEVLKDINLDIVDGEFVVLVGPSGCGKSTLLRTIAGLESLTGGEIRLDGDVINDLEPRERNLAMVFQSYALYPHMTAARNMGFSLEIRKATKDKIKAAVEKAAGTLGLSDLLARQPKELSGGQRQRVAMGRALVRNPKAFLLDEPLSNLDAALRVSTRFEIAKLHNELKPTMVYVTHDQVEAMTLADKIVVMKAGRIEQVGSPIELYNRPANLFVAQFIGSPKMNVLTCQSDATGIGLDADHTIRPADWSSDLQVTHIGIRPEHITLVDLQEADIVGTVLVAEHLGSDTFLYTDISKGDPIIVRLIGEATPAVGDKVGLRFDPDRTHMFGNDGICVGRGADPSSHRGQTI